MNSELTARVFGYVRRAVEKAREGGVPVVWVQHQNAKLVPGSVDWQWVPELCPAAAEPVIPKRLNSAFEDTMLDAMLAGLGATHLVLAGCATNWCIRATAYAALDCAYDLKLVKNAHTTDTVVVGDGRRIEAAQIIDDLNMTMNRLEYPGRSNRLVAVDTLDLAGLGAAGWAKRWCGREEAARRR
jgi:nicotinamidase-related amidase